MYIIFLRLEQFVISPIRMETLEAHLPNVSVRRLEPYELVPTTYI